MDAASPAADGNRGLDQGRDAATRPDAALTADAAPPDAQRADAATLDAGPADARPADAARSADAGGPDAGDADARAPDAEGPEPDAEGPEPDAEGPEPDADLRPDAFRPLECPGWRTTRAPPEGGRVELPERRRFELLTGCGAGTSLVSVVRLDLPRPARVEVVSEPRTRVTYWLACGRGGLDPAVGCAPPLPLALDLEAGSHTFVVDAPATALDVRVTEGPAVPACGNEGDDDGDGLVDLADDGCTDLLDPSELPPVRVPACANGIDDDGDGHTDWPADPSCTARGWPFEACEVVPHRVLEVADPRQRALSLSEIPLTRFPFPGSQGPVSTRFLLLDPNHGSGHVFMRSNHPLAVWPGCATTDLLGTGVNFDLHLPQIGEPLLVALWERPGAPPPTLLWSHLQSDGSSCGDGLDPDRDGRTDLADPDCPSPFAEGESGAGTLQACANGEDDDGDGLVDWPADPDCQGAGDFAEVSACAGPRAVLAAGGGSLGYHHVADRATGSCGRPGTPEVLAQVHLERPSWLVMGRNEGIVHIRSDCNRPESEVFCGLVTEPIGPLPAGDWYVFAEGPLADRRLAVVPAPACADGIDNDGDGATDVADGGCRDELDAEEGAAPAPPTACADGLDNDGDDLVDWPADPECRALGDPREHPLCPGLDDFEFEPGGLRGAVLAGIDPQPAQCNDERLVRSIVIPLAVPPGGMVGASDAASGSLGLVDVGLTVSEACDAQPEVCPPSRFPADDGPWLLFLEGRASQSAITYEPRLTWGFSAACADRIDNDDDGRVDAADPGCWDWQDESEVDGPQAPACHNGRDDDADGQTDFPADPECGAPSDTEEAGPCVAGWVPDGPPIVAPGGWRYPFTRSDGHPLPRRDCGYRGAVDMRPVVVQVDVPSRLTARTHHSDGDPLLRLRRGCELAPGEHDLACDDDSGPFTEAELTADLEVPGEYVILVALAPTYRRVGTALEVTLEPLP